MGKVRWNKRRHREHGGVEAVEMLANERPHIRIGRRRVDVTSPHPSAGPPRTQAEDPGRLWIVQKDKVVLALEQLGVSTRRAQVGLPLRFGESLRAALEPVMNLLRDLEEPLVAADDPPVRDDAEVVEERHNGSQ